MERYEKSSRALMILTMIRYGRPVYGRRDYVWYYELDGRGHIGRGFSVARDFTVRYYPGDCTGGEESLQITWDGVNWKDMGPIEYDSAHLRGALDHGAIDYYPPAKHTVVQQDEQEVHVVG